MLSTKRTLPVRKVMITEEVRVPSPKKRTPLSRAPSVTPVTAKIELLARSQVFCLVDSLHVFDAHPRQAFLLIRLRRRRPSMCPFRRRIAAAVVAPSGAPPEPMTACTPVPITAAASTPAERSPSPIRPELSPPGRTNVGKFLFHDAGRSSTITTRSSTSRVQPLRNIFQIIGDGRIQVDCILRMKAPPQFFECTADARER